MLDLNILNTDRINCWRVVSGEKLTAMPVVVTYPIQ